MGPALPTPVPDAADARLTRIRPDPPRVSSLIGELLTYRELFFVLAARDIKVRYKQTVLGVAWALIQPVVSMVVLSIIFGRLAGLPSDGIPYPVFVYAGLLPWTFFSSSMSSSANSLLNISHLLTKVYFPRLLIPLAPLGAHLVDFLISCSVVVGLMLYYQVPFTLHLLAAPLVIGATLLVAVGTGAMLSALVVTYRDLRIVLPYGIQLLMYASPVVWAPSLVPEHLRWVLYLNPLAGLIDGFRSSLLGRPFNLEALAISGGMAVVLFVLGMFVFTRFERRAIDLL